MQNRGLLVILLTFFMALGNIPLISPESSELYYDDGHFDYAWADFYPMAAAVRFSPPFPNWRIEQIRFYGVCYLRPFFEGTIFYVEIWDISLNVMYHGSFSFNSFFKGKNSTLDWYTIAVPDIITSGDFYVVIIPFFTLDGPQLWIGADESPPIYNTSLLVDCRSHQIIKVWDLASGRPKNFMVRVTGQSVPTTPELRLTSIQANLNRTVMAFTLIGAKIKGVRATLLPPGLYNESGLEEVECNVSIVDETHFSVTALPFGYVHVYAETDSGTTSTTVDIGGNIWSYYFSLARRIEDLEFYSEDKSRTIDELKAQNSQLRSKLNESQALVSALSTRIDKLTQNATALSKTVADLNERVKTLTDESLRLSALFIIMAVVIVALVISASRRWRI